ncbi:hypothetical protein BBW65_00810 [Helicobacter enhydrae]|uniref:VTT domain-containing protein n=1 Tax=Helicobacter enhydrae TaxID=222136 RepID=A0A1B1U3Z0_9HELI|nr:DedA family protein [Helicobacter enhydrae]ANV97442.1 hypothetical protein BBW65_00810 [Helicobacter enhydrae]
MGFEQWITELWNEHIGTWGYLILFCWSVLEGELGLIMAGLASHDGHMNLALAIFVAGLGGFAGDQIYFYIGRFNKSRLTHMLQSQRRKFALAHILLKKYGWPIIFAQRYMYGMRTIIPISIGLTRYSAIKFAIINLLSAWVWAAITIVFVWYFGDLIWEIIGWFKSRPYLLVPLAIALFGGIAGYFHFKTKKTKENK